MILIELAPCALCSPDGRGLVVEAWCQVIRGESGDLNCNIGMSLTGSQQVLKCLTLRFLSSIRVVNELMCLSSWLIFSSRWHQPLAM
jgi:hypothetical protein